MKKRSTTFFTRARAALALAGALGLAACSSVPAPPQPTSAQAQQAAVMRVMMVSMTQRDEFVESMTGLKRTEPVFPAVKSSLGELFGDRVVVDWMVMQMERDRAGFQREWGRMAARGMMAVDDAGALKMLLPVAKAGGRMSADECKAMEARKSASKSDSFFVMLRSMQPDEARDFFDGMRLALRAGIRGDAPRAASTPDQIGKALASGALGTLGMSARDDSCGALSKVAQALDVASPQDRAHMVNFMMASAGLAAQGQR